MTIEIRRFSSAQSDFAQQMDSLLSWESVSDAGVQKTVADIIYDIRTRGDEALIEFTNKFDRMEATSMAELELNQEQLQAAVAMRATASRDFSGKHLSGLDPAAAGTPYCAPLPGR